MNFPKTTLFISAVAFCGLNVHAQTNRAALIVAFSGTNGSAPYTAMTEGIDGNLYGTTGQGGSNYDGTIFELSSNNVFTTLFNFGFTNGNFPPAKLLRSTNHNFYGVTYGGGSNQYGSVFEFTTNGNLISLYSFDGTNGGNPWGGLIQASDGNFYGTTSGGGTGFNGFFGSGSGTIFMMTPQGAFTNLYQFTGGTDGATSYGTLVEGTNGNLYGTTYSGGTGNGTIFEWKLDPSLEEILAFDGSDGANPAAGPVLNRRGFMVGTTAAGGSNGKGEVYTLDYEKALRVVYNFGGPDGATPYGPLVCCGDCYYGTTYSGGTYNQGAVVSVEIRSVIAARETVLYSFKDQLDGGFPEGGVTAYHNHLFVTTTESTIGTVYGGGTLIELVESPRLTRLGPTFKAGVFSATYEVQPTWTYQPQYSPDLLPGTWSAWGHSITPTERTYTFGGTVSARAGFLRLQVEPPGLLPP
ncbi:MAG TPA: choice-of-anchor tandem repeat GloVer-containing protein [Verrucomicrobiae bacterium]|jgi:uncharacterized repeat protein (TIGR03803 family)|nr:choice-of-anchor tandem repeat GloVer-containing protein [Verrucomicrobiae bacterium]